MGKNEMPSKGESTNNYFHMYVYKYKALIGKWRQKRINLWKGFWTLAILSIEEKVLDLEQVVNWQQKI